MIRYENRDILISNSKFALSKITEQDRANYVELQRQINGESSLFLNPFSKDIMWESVLNDNGIYVILDAKMSFIGTLEIKDESRLPEIGISILKAHRNQGIAKEAISLLIELTYDSEKIDYYTLRIQSDNLHSRHVFEKMGAVYLGEDLSTAEAFAEHLKAAGWEEKQKADMMEFFTSLEGDSSVVRYKLDPKNASL